MDKLFAPRNSFDLVFKTLGFWLVVGSLLGGGCVWRRADRASVLSRSVPQLGRERSASRTVAASSPAATRASSVPSAPARAAWPVRQVAAEEPVSLEPLPNPVPQPLGPADETDSVPIDLGKAWAIAGASDLQVEMAREKTVQALARFDRARFAWLPTFRLGISWNKHDGRLQATEGNVINRGRNSLFVGGGAGLGSMPLDGGAGGPPRLMVNFSLADAFFDAKVASQRAAAAQFGETAVLNQTLLSVGRAYIDLMVAHGKLANARRVRDSAAQLAKLLQQFREAGSAAQADVDRLNVELARRERQLEDARRAARVSAARLARLLRLDVRETLVPAEEQVLAWELVPPGQGLDQWLETAWAQNPELTRTELRAVAAEIEDRKEMWRPFLPSVQVGASAGTFGGGPSSQFDNQGSRSDVDVLAVWELENAGLGNRARRDEAASRWREAGLRAQWLRDAIGAKVAQAYYDWQSYQRQLEIAQQAAKTAEEAYRRSRERIRAGEGLPIELVQSLDTYATALDDYVETVGKLDLAQLRLLHAAGTGLPLSNSLMTSAAE